jgi:multimeric flavodoxin WrbA
MKKILILSASPRKNGNSDLLAEQFRKGAEESGNTVTVIRLAEKKINYCHGCYYCAKHNGECCQKDDEKEIIDQMIAADVIVLATPTYFYSMDGQMKVFIDRTVCRYLEIRNKEFYYIVTSWDPEKKNIQKVIDALNGFVTDCLEGATVKGILYGTGCTDAGDVKNKPIYQEAYETGKNIG